MDRSSPDNSKTLQVFENWSIHAHFMILDFIFRKCRNIEFQCYHATNIGINVIQWIKIGHHLKADCLRILKLSDFLQFEAFYG